MTTITPIKATAIDRKNEFIELINKVFSECAGFETYGATTEFYDEDGIVLMTAVEDESGKNVTFNFNGAENPFDALKEDFYAA